MIYAETERYTLYQGKMQDELNNLESNSVDCIITDPPYELGFMNKSWDSTGVAFQKSTWEKCLRVLKPGGYLLSFGGSRTFHRIACAIEDAGFEIRDTIMYLYGSGFPKSMNIGLAIDKKMGIESEMGGVKPGHQEFVNRTTDGDTRFEGGMNGFDRPWMHDIDKRKAYHYQKLPTSEEAKQWDGWGTSLKPAFEPIIVARKPLDGTCVDNVLKWGVGGINIDECRVPTEDTLTHGGSLCTMSGDNRYGKSLGMFQDGTDNTYVQNPDGRFPANTILTYDEEDFEEVCGGFPDSGSGNNGTPYNYAGREYNNKSSSMFNGDKPQACSNYNDNGSAARYFYCAKASKADREEGLEASDGRRINNHPTVKPTSLMRYLIRLVAPKNAIILDPFMGSGSTGKAAMIESNAYNKNYKFIGVEMTESYLPISQARIEYGINYIDEESPKKSTKSKTTKPVSTDKPKSSSKKLF